MSAVLTPRQQADAALVQAMGYGCGFTVERSDADILAERAAEMAVGTEGVTLCRWLYLVGSERFVFAAFCDDDAHWIVEPVQERAQDEGTDTVLRPLHCKDAEAEGGLNRYEHNLKHHDGRDPDVRVPHWSCSRCGRNELDESDFDSVTR